MMMITMMVMMIEMMIMTMQYDTYFDFKMNGVIT